MSDGVERPAAGQAGRQVADGQQGGLAESVRRPSHTTLLAAAAGILAGGAAYAFPLVVHSGAAGRLLRVARELALEAAQQWGAATQHLGSLTLDRPTPAAATWWAVGGLTVTTAVAAALVWTHSRRMSRAGRRERSVKIRPERVQQLAARGQPVLEIARQTGLSQDAVALLLRARPVTPTRQIHPLPARIAPFAFRTPARTKPASSAQDV